MRNMEERKRRREEEETVDQEVEKVHQDTEEDEDGTLMWFCVHRSLTCICRWNSCSILSIYSLLV